jgi:uncharacterized repeat protein (TIGR03803 family)
MSAKAALAPIPIVIVIVSITAITLSLCVAAHAQTESVLYIFGGGGDGQYPSGTVAVDAKGNVYGTVSSGGESSCEGIGCGVLYELSPSSNSWTYSQVWGYQGPDGDLPLGGVYLSSAGNLYATTNIGGNFSYCTLFDTGCGTVGRFSPSSDGTWTQQTLLEFTGPGNGSYPLANVFLDKAGNLYGTTEYGGSSDYCNGAYSGCGVVFKLSPDGNGEWTESVLYVFQSGKQGRGRGFLPWSGVVVDSAGNVYGTTSSGGIVTDCIIGCGVVYKLSPTGTGAWTYSVIYEFTGKSDGAYPIGGVILGPKGNLYGAAQQAGDLSACNGQGCGTVYELSPRANGSWQFQLLHTFSQTDGDGPSGTLTFDRKGNLYGTTLTGGDLSCSGGYGCGTVFRLSPSSKGWQLATLHAFNNPPDGALPSAGVTLDASGNIFGETQYGGLTSLCCGTVFEIKP